MSEVREVTCTTSADSCCQVAAAAAAASAPNTERRHGLQFTGFLLPADDATGEACCQISFLLIARLWLYFSGDYTLWNTMR